MERLKLTLTAQTPLCISDRRPAGQFRESTEFVPGAVLRGAVAALMLDDGQESSKEFQSFFNSGRPAVFTNAYPASRVLPATAMSCKAEPGFRRKGHGVADTLIKRLCFESLKPAGPLYRPRCPECQTRMERHTGFYRQHGDRYITERVTQRLLTRVAINRRRATAEDQLLYSPIVISEGRWEASRASGGETDDGRNYIPARFEGTVTVSAHADVLEQYLKKLDHIGSGTSRGLGWVTTEVEPPEDEDDLESLRGRRKVMNDEIKQQWDKLKKFPGCADPPHSPDKGSYFTIDLYSDAVLKEHGLLPTMTLSARMLKERCQVEDDSLQLVRSYSGYDYRGGWNTAWGLPKDVDAIVPMGSVFVFWTEHPDQWDGALLELEQWGIGERIVEGFGQIRVCDEFHEIQGGGV